jgi:type II secretory pathway pseudopilin PulG
MFKNLKKKLKSNAGNSLAEFAVVTAMMGTLASTAAPKFGGVGDGAKAKQTIATLDKIKTAANNFYNAKVSEEGRGRFPGQSKYDSKVGGFDLPDSTLTDAALETYLETILANQTAYTSTLDDYVYVFSTSLTDEDALAGDWMSFAGQTHQVDVLFDTDGAADFVKNFGNSGIKSPFQDGAYIYLVIPGSGSGTSAQAPALIVADIENPSQLHKTLTP